MKHSAWATIALENSIQTETDLFLNHPFELDEEDFARQLDSFLSKQSSASPLMNQAMQQVDFAPSEVLASVA